jgi:hypothetical protein
VEKISPGYFAPQFAVPVRLETFYLLNVKWWQLTILQLLKCHSVPVEVVARLDQPQLGLLAGRFHAS